MDQTHIHLMITHLPIFATFLGFIILIYAFWAKSDETKIAAFIIFIISAIGAQISFLTGEGAEDRVEKIQGVATAMIHDHEEFAEIAIVGMISLGVLSLLGIFITYKKYSFQQKYTVGILLLSLVCFGLISYTGYLGGQIRHTEISGANGEFNTLNSNQDDDDD